MDTTTLIVLIACIAVVVLALGAVFYRRRRSSSLREEFASEYDKTKRRAGGTAQAERELEARRKRVDALDIRALSSEQRERYSSEWREVQTRFVDEPMDAIGDANRLLNDVLMARGYPVRDFDRRVEDLSVDHGPLIAKYRKAHGIAKARDAGVEPDTEQVRQAFVAYRDIFDELLGAESVPAEAVRRSADGDRRESRPGRPSIQRG
jgi:hypothetical protein